MATSTLMNHHGARDVSREELQVIDAPPPTATWFPIAHRDVLDRVSESLEGAGFSIVKSRLSLSNGDQRFFGTLDLQTRISAGVNLVAGIRNSTDKSFPIGFCCGQRVFVCDNLAFTSEIVVSKKHTRFGRERYLEGLARAVGTLPQYQAAASDWIERLSHWDLSEDAANSYILQAFEKDVISSRLLPLAIKEWREPAHEEFRPRTGWSLFNAFTTVLGRTKQATNPAAAALTTIRLQRLLTPEVIDVQSTSSEEWPEERWTVASD